MDISRHSRRSKCFTDDSSVTISVTPPSPLQYLGIPFSWELFPGIPKKNTHKKNNSSENLLPLPPSCNSVHQRSSVKKFSGSRSVRKDPFFAAFVECSRDKGFELDGVRKNSKILGSDRSGFAVSMYSSCKRTCAVSESIVYRSRSATGYVLATDRDLTVAKSKP